MTIMQEDFLVVLDFNPDITCETTLKECPNPVYYRLSKDCCDKVYLICKECGDQTVKVLNSRYWLQCYDCKSGPLPNENFHMDAIG